MKKIFAIPLSHGAKRHAMLSGAPRRLALIIGTAVLILVTGSLISIPGASSLSATPAEAAVTGDLQIAIDANASFIATIQGSSDEVVNYWTRPNGLWYGSAAIGGTARSDSPITISDSGQDVVFIDSSGNVVEDVRNPSTGTWTGPTALGGTARAGSPLAFSGNGTTVAFVNSSGDVVVDTLSGGTWSGPTAIGGTARSDSPMSINDNATHVYFVDTDNYVTNDWVANGAWAGPSRIGGQAKAGSSMADSTSGNIVAFINPSGYVVNDWIDSSGGWSGPAELGGTARAGSPLALDGSPTHAYFVNTSGDVVNDWVSDGVWKGPAGIGGSAVSGSGMASSSSGPSVVAFLSSTGVSLDWATGGYWHGPGFPDTISTNIKGGNWPVDYGTNSEGNYQSGPLIINGLSTSDTPAQAEADAATIVGNFYSSAGANTVRIPINEATVSSSTYWPIYAAAIQGMLTKGNVIITYWAYQNGKPANMTNYWNMWKTVVDQFGSNNNVLFEPINEPYGYSTASALVDDIYNPWLSDYSSVPRFRVLLDGLGYADNVGAVASLVSGTRFSVHDYSWFDSSTLSESGWANHLAGEIGGYGASTVMTEWGAAMTGGANYDVASSDNVVSYVRGMSDEARGLGIGSVYWPAIGVGDSFRMYTLSGTSLTVTNQSGLDRLRYSWGD